MHYPESPKVTLPAYFHVLFTLMPAQLRMKVLPTGFGFSHKLPLIITFKMKMYSAVNMFSYCDKASAFTSFEQFRKINLDLSFHPQNLNKTVFSGSKTVATRVAVAI